MAKRSNQRKNRRPSNKTAVDDAAPAAASARRRWVFRALVIAAPFLAVLGAELVCRACGFGGYPPILSRAGDDGQGRIWYAANRAGIASFFHRQLGGAGGMRDLAFTTPAPADTVRIAFIGDSAMQGYPQPLPLTNGAFLVAMLNDIWGGERRAEVLNLACTAVASFVELEILKEALEHDLDLVVIMAGNNEYFGAYGVASLHRAGATPAGMRFTRWSRRFALSQWIDTLSAEKPPDTPGRRQVLMERMAAVQQIGPDDALRAAGANVAQAHLSAMARLAARHGVPVMLCTLPTNERDMRPIGADIEPPLTAKESAAFHDLLARAEGALDHDPAAAAEALTTAARTYDRHALSRYLLGQSLSRLGRHEEALGEFIAARDFDTMPWRATSATNDAVRTAAAETGATLCDMEAAFREASPGGAIGWELMDDHVHLSLRGQALFAETVARHMTKLPGPLSVDSASLERLPVWQIYAERLGRNLYDECASALHLNKLFDAEFFARTNPQARERNRQRLAELHNRVAAADRPAVDEWAARHMAVDRPITAVVGMAAKARGTYGEAAACFEMAARCAGSVSLWRLQYAVEAVSCRRRATGALSDVDRARAREAIEIAGLLERFAGLPNPVGTAYAGLACHYAGRPAEAIKLLEQAIRYMQGREALDVIEALTEALVQTGQVDRARQLLELATHDPGLREWASGVLATPPFAPS